MAKSNQNLPEDLEFDELDDLNDLSDDDYVFVVRSDGSMKSVIFPPSDTFDYSDKLLEVFAVFGVHDPDSIAGNHTIH